MGCYEQWSGWRDQNRLERGRKGGQGHLWGEGEDNLKGERAETIEEIQRSRRGLVITKKM